MKIILLAICVFVVSCKEKNKTTCRIVEIPSYNIAKESGPNYLSEIIDSSFVVRLETSKNCIIGKIDKIEIFNNRIFVLDKFKSKSLFEFRMNGTFIRKYGNNGKGPGEYGRISSFVVNSENKQLIIVDWAPKQLLFYNLKGEFIKSKKIKARVNQIEAGMDGYIYDIHGIIQKHGGHKEKPYSLAETNLYGKVKNFSLRQFSKVKGYSSFKNLVDTDKGILFNEPFTNTIYKIEENNVRPFIEINVDNPIPETVYGKYGYKDFKDKLDEGNYSYFDNVLGYSIVNDVIMLSVVQERYYSRYLYSLKTKKSYLINNIPNYDIDSFGFIGQYMCSYNDFFVNYVESERLLSRSKFYKSRVIKSFIDKTNESDNPVLVFNKLKNKL